MSARQPAGAKHHGSLRDRWIGYDSLAAEQQRAHRRRESRGVPNLCGRCAAGVHAFEHGETGCMRKMGVEPRDWVCQCPVVYDRKAAILRRLRELSRALD